MFVDPGDDGKNQGRGEGSEPSQILTRVVKTPKRYTGRWTRMSERVEMNCLGLPGFRWVGDVSHRRRESVGREGRTEDHGHDSTDKRGDLSLEVSGVSEDS